MGLREVDVVGPESPGPEGIVEVPPVEIGASIAYRVVAASAPNREVEVVEEKAAPDPERRTRTTRLRIRPLAPRERVRVTLEEARSPWPAEDLYVRQGSRIDLDVAADTGVEVTLPRDAVVSRTGLARARVGNVRGRIVVRVPPSPDERLRLEAVVPSLTRSWTDEAAAYAAAETAMRAVAAMDGAAFRAAVAPEYHSAFLDDPVRAERSLAGIREKYERADTDWGPWSTDREGDRMVVRRVVRRWNLYPKGGGPPEPPVGVPRVHVAYCRLDEGRWRVVEETMAALSPIAGQLDADGVFVVEEIGLVVRPPFGARVRAGEGGTGDVEVLVTLDEPRLHAEVMGYLRARRGMGIPPITAEDLRLYGFTLLDADPEIDRDGTKVIQVRHAQVKEGGHYVGRRRTLLRGDVAVVALIEAEGATTAEAEALLAKHKDLVARFLDSVSLRP